MLCVMRVIFWALQPSLTIVSLGLIAEPFNVGPRGALADFAERTVPLLFAITLLLVVYQWIDTMLSYFFGASNDQDAVSKRLVTVRMALIAAAVALAIPGMLRASARE